MNKSKIAKFILYRKYTSKSEIAAKLGISMPAVLQNVKELLEDHIVNEVGQYRSTGGRKAKALAINENIRYSAGIEITANHISCVMINVCGEIIARRRVRKSFQNKEDYYQELSEEFENFMDGLEIDREKVLGVGVSLPGIVDRENQVLVKSHALNISNLNLQVLSGKLKIRSVYENNANSAALAEVMERDRDLVYLSLSNTVGGSIYLFNSIYGGDHFRSAEFGHIILVPGGKMCCCGKAGCINAYCSAKVLSGYTRNNLEEFFEKLDQGDGGAAALWEEYMEHLAIVVTNLRMAFDCDIILGGYVGGYMKKYMNDFTSKVIRYNDLDKDTLYLYTCSCTREASAVGIALSFVEEFFETL